MQENVLPYGIQAYVVALVSALILTPIIRWICVRYSLQADPNPIIATHKTATPTLGGVGIYIAFFIALSVVMIPSGETSFLLKLFLGTLPIFLMGIYDDLRGLSFKFKGVAEIFLVIIFIVVFQLKPEFNIHPVFEYLLMVLWFVGIINAFNLIDIMDGLASGIGLFASFGFFLLAAISGPDKAYLLPIAGALAGCYLAFLHYNFNPAKIFLGDNGSLVMGLALAYLGFELVGHEPLSFKVMAPVIILAIPIFEVFLLVIRRMKKKISVFEGSPDHTALVIQALGYSIPQTAWIIYLLSVILVAIGLWVWKSSDIIQVTVSLALLILAGFLLRHMRDIKVQR
ncbi:MAG: MraY family glycosyltransferase [bacterium]